MVNTAATSENDTRGWDLLLYMSSENSLLAESMKNIQDIRDSAQTPLMNVVIFQDQETRTNLETLRGGSIRTTVKKGQVDFSDPATLRGFLDEAQGEFPDGGPGKILILWGHGRGMLFLSDDQSKGRAMDVIGAASVLRRPRTKKEFSIVGFDACFMCVLEVVADFADACTYFIASPALIPATGWAYAEILEALGALYQVPTAADMATLITNQYQRKYQARYPNNKNVELSTIKTADLPDLVTAFRALGDELAKYLDPSYPSAPSFREMLTLARQVASTPPGAFDYVDAVDLIRNFQARLQETLPADFDATARQSLADACEQFLAKAIAIFAEDRQVPSFLIWFPLQPGVHARWRNLYEGLSISQQSDGSGVAGWARMLRKYHGITDEALQKEEYENHGGAILMALRDKDMQRTILDEKLAVLVSRAAPPEESIKGS